jgi:two-component system chemotaxis response regulator CheY
MLALILDDMVEMTTLLRMVLEQSGYQVITAHNGGSGLRLLTHMTTDRCLIICDIHMPLMGGRDFMLRVRQDERWSKLPVIAISVDPAPEARRKALEDGADCFLVKPFEFSELSRMLICLHLPPLLRMSGEVW